MRETLTVFEVKGRRKEGREEGGQGKERRRMVVEADDLRGGKGVESVDADATWTERFVVI